MKPWQANSRHKAVQLVGLAAKLQMFIARTELIFCLLHERKGSWKGAL